MSDSAPSSVLRSITRPLIGDIRWQAPGWIKGMGNAVGFLWMVASSWIRSDKKRAMIAAGVAALELIATREIVDAKEHERAIVARGKARTAIVRECCASSFGLLCPVGNEDKLAAAIAEAQRRRGTERASLGDSLSAVAGVDADALGAFLDRVPPAPSNIEETGLTEVDLINNRLAPTSMEPRQALGEGDRAQFSVEAVGAVGARGQVPQAQRKTGVGDLAPGQFFDR